MRDGFSTRKLVVAGIGQDGKLYFGVHGDIHHDLIQRYPKASPWIEWGFLFL